jgi:hypothetical protein
MISTVLWLLDDMLSLKTGINGPTVRNKHLESHRQKEQDPYQNVTDPENWSGHNETSKINTFLQWFWSLRNFLKMFWKYVCFRVWI